MTQNPLFLKRDQYFICKVNRRSKLRYSVPLSYCWNSTPTFADTRFTETGVQSPHTYLFRQTILMNPPLHRRDTHRHALHKCDERNQETKKMVKRTSDDQTQQMAVFLCWADTNVRIFTFKWLPCFFKTSVILCLLLSEDWITSDGLFVDFQTVSIAEFVLEQNGFWLVARFFFYNKTILLFYINTASVCSGGSILIQILTFITNKRLSFQLQCHHCCINSTLWCFYTLCSSSAQQWVCPEVSLAQIEFWFQFY